MKIIGDPNLGKLKIYYAAPKKIIDVINEKDFPDGLKKEYTVDRIIGGFHIQAESFTIMNSKNGHNPGQIKHIQIFPYFTFKFGENDLENADKSIFYAKLKSLRGKGCIVSCFLRYKRYEWLFIAKFPKLTIPNQFPFVEDGLDYSDF